MTAPNLDALAALLAKATPGHHPLSTAESAAHHMANAKDEIVRALPALLAYVRELESLVERMARSDSNVAIAMRERCAQACDRLGTFDGRSLAAKIRALEPK